MTIETAFFIMGILMFYKIKRKIQFRNYKEYGYITDNSLFGYKYLNDYSKKLGERYVSESGAVFFEVLSKVPQAIDDIVNKLDKIFVGVDRSELKNDAIEFYDQFVSEGFLCSGKTYEECDIEKELIENCKKLNKIENCSSDILRQENILRGIHIEIANICNERCIHCYIPHDVKTKIIDEELFYKIVENGRKQNILNVTLSGGEPLVHKAICKFLKKCRELDLSVNILSNLTLLNDDIMEEIKKNPLISIQVSLYSIDPLVHDAITNLKGSCEKTKNSIKKLVENGIPVQIACPIMKQNKSKYEEVLEWGKTFNIPVIIDYMIFAEYDHTGENIKNRLSEQDICSILDNQFEKNKTYLQDMYDKAIENTHLTPKSAVCSICKYYFCVSAEGDAFPCAGWQKYKLGSLKTKTVEEIWEKSEKVKYLRGIKREGFIKCMKCEDKDYCTICMMKNFNETIDEDMFAPNEFNCKLSSIIHLKIIQHIK